MTKTIKKSNQNKVKSKKSRMRNFPSNVVPFLHIGMNELKLEPQEKLGMLQDIRNINNNYSKIREVLEKHSNLQAKLSQLVTNQRKKLERTIILRQCQLATKVLLLKYRHVIFKFFKFPDLMKKYTWTTYYAYLQANCKRKVATQKQQEPERETQSENQGMMIQNVRPVVEVQDQDGQDMDNRGNQSYVQPNKDIVSKQAVLSTFDTTEKTQANKANDQNKKKQQIKSQSPQIQQNKLREEYDKAMEMLDRDKQFDNILEQSQFGLNGINLQAYGRSLSQSQLPQIDSPRSSNYN